MIISRWHSYVVESDLNYSPSTVKNYISMLHRWTSNWLDRPAAELTRGDGREVLDEVKESGRSKSFQKRVKNTINMIFNWAIEEKIVRGVHNSPVYGIKIDVKSEKRPEILKANEIRKLLFESKRQNHKWYYVWAMALLTGMRNGELYALRWSI